MRRIRTAARRGADILHRKGGQSRIRVSQGKFGGMILAVMASEEDATKKRYLIGKENPGPLRFHFTKFPRRGRAGA